MSKFYWFGDSWVAGDELEIELGGTKNQNKKYSFPQLVSDHFGVECVNLGESGISNDLLPLILFKNIKNINPEKDTVFFCLTSIFRVSFLSEFYKPKTVLPSIHDNALRNTEHPHWKEWYKYFDNPAQRIFNFNRNINFLFTWCKNIGIKFYFLNLFTKQTHSVFDITDQSVWLLPSNQCVADFILPVTDSEFGGMVMEDREWLTNLQWQEQQSAIKKYINPCAVHPNLLGHRTISQHIIELLDQNIRDNGAVG